jgi:hypothetical protein
VDLGDLRNTCKDSTYLTITGLPGLAGPVTVSWNGVQGATSYSVIALGKNVPAWGAAGKTLGSAHVPASPAVLHFAAADVTALLNAQGYFDFIVQAHNDRSRFDGICIITRIIRAVPFRPTPSLIPPSATPWINNPGQRGTCPPGWVGVPPHCVDHR